MNPDPTGGASMAAPPPAPAAAPVVPPAPPIPTMADLVRRGVPPAQASALIQQFQKVDETNSTIAKTRAEAAKVTKEANDLVAQQASDMANSLVRTAVPGQPINPDLLNWNLQHFASLGPQEAAQAQDVRAHLATLAPADQITFLKTLAGTPKTSEANSRADDAQTAAERLATEKPKMIADGTLAQLTAAGKAPIQPVEQARLNQEAQNINLRAREFSLRTQEFNQKYGDAVGQLSPTNLAIAKKLAVGDFNPAQLGRLPGKEAIIAGAIALNPNWTPQTFETKESFTNPEKLQAKNLGTISRIVGHIGRFEKNSQSLGVAPLYGVAGVNFGGTAKSISEDAHAISAELEKLASGGVGSEGQIKSWQADLRSTLPGVRQKAVDEISHLVGSQYEGMAQTYKAGTGFDLPVKKFLTPDAQAWMTSKGINIATSSEAAPSTAPAGSPMTATGPNGHKIVSSDGGNTWVDPQTGQKVQ